MFKKTFRKVPVTISFIMGHVHNYIELLTRFWYGNVNNT